MRCVKLFVLVVIAMAFSACGSSNDAEINEGRISIQYNNKAGIVWTFLFDEALVTTGKPTPGMGENAEENDTVSDPAENSNPGQAQGHLLVNGAIYHSNYDGGNFLVEIRGSKSCGDQLCADMAGNAYASSLITKPTYFSLVIPQVESALYLVARYTDSKHDEQTREIYLGTVTERMDDLKLDFSPDIPEPEEPEVPASPEPTPSPGGFGGPTDLQANS